jgi:hypothetical protein
MNIFEKATREKLRFSSAKGQLNVEDLWGLSLAALDRIAVGIHEKLESSGTKSFIGRPSVKSREESLRFEIVKHIIDVKVQENEDSRKKVEVASQKEFLENLLKEKKMDELKGLTPEQIEEKIKNLG